MTTVSPETPDAYPYVVSSDLRPRKRTRRGDDAGANTCSRWPTPRTPRTARAGLDADLVHRRQVDHEPAIADGLARPTVSAAGLVPDVLHVFLCEQIGHAFDTVIAGILGAAADPEQLQLIVRFLRVGDEVLVGVGR